MTPGVPPADHSGADTQQQPRVLLIVGAAGSGKSTVAGLLADRLDWPHRDADEFHSAHNRAKMAAGLALSDADREPWLDDIRAWMDRKIAAGLSIVVTCSALKRAYRNRLIGGRPEVRLIYLRGAPALLRSRLGGRRGHFFPAELLQSQLADLEEPEPDEDPLVVEIDQPPEAIVDAVLSLLRRETAPGDAPTGADGFTSGPFGMPGVSPGPTGERWELRRGGQSAVVVQLGATLTHYTVDGRAVLDGVDAGSPISGGRGQLLIPWPNRIGGGRYRFDGVDQQLPLTEPERLTAIHGLLRWTPWRLLARSDEAVRVGTSLFPQPGYPFLLDVVAQYRLGPDGLEVVICATNAGETAAPYGVGQHPYLTVGTDTVDSTLLTVPGEYWLPTDEQGLPTGRESVAGSAYDFRTERPIGALRLDTAFTGLTRDERGRAFVQLTHPSRSHGVDIWLGEGARYVQLYTGDTLSDPGHRRRGVAVEAMSCPPDAFRSGADLTVLQPGASHVLRWGLSPWASA
ncbi:gluconokinase, GntK/IdnK-type [Streptomyces sp. NBC_00234]|uniref:aldose epimerase family protein n=1 Tax=Streptomyces sp. NBC_00234 TaxID=2903638 RepID=UPI002E2D6E7A|nr:gluconokinase, GntK/IdnK-type [Streptomyces sp. NBC_00234]